MSVGRPLRSTVPCHGRPGGRPGLICARRAHRSTGCRQATPPVDRAVDRVLSWPAACAVLAPFDFRSLCYLLYLLYLLSSYTLDDNLPCIDTATANESMNRIVNIVDQAIGNISNMNFPPLFGPPLNYNQSGPLVPPLCSPYLSDMSDRTCLFGEVNFGKHIPGKQ